MLGLTLQEIDEMERWYVQHCQILELKKRLQKLKEG